jgi:hypothetical protein
MALHPLQVLTRLAPGLATRLCRSAGVSGESETLVVGVCRFQWIYEELVLGMPALLRYPLETSRL